MQGPPESPAQTVGFTKISPLATRSTIPVVRFLFMLFGFVGVCPKPIAVIV